VRGMLLLLTWVWRKRGIVSLESACKIANYVARGKCVEAPPAPSPCSLSASFAENFPVNCKKSNVKIGMLKLLNWGLKIIIIDF